MFSKELQSALTLYNAVNQTDGVVLMEDASAKISIQGDFVTHVKKANTDGNAQQGAPGSIVVLGVEGATGQQDFVFVSRDGQGPTAQLQQWLNALRILTAVVQITAIVFKDHAYVRTVLLERDVRFALKVSTASVVPHPVSGGLHALVTEGAKILPNLAAVCRIGTE